MKYTLCYLMLFFAAQTDNISGILRGMKEMNRTPYYLEPEKDIK